MIIWQTPAFIMLLGYLLGSIPFGIILTRFAGTGDIRQMGSGSTGATNVLRTGKKGLAAATLLLDLAKGALAVAIGGHLLANEALANGGTIAGVMALIGHCYPVWLRFAGGKGVATMMGVVLALAWPLGFIFATLWLGMLVITRISSAGGITAALGAPIACLATGRLDLFAPCAAMALIVLWRHRTNIARLMVGKEPRIGSAKS
ncbi:MAG: glycerol-3-phosphate 1-O-acyltransferase PlsY [Sphingobium sp.]